MLHFRLINKRILCLLTDDATTRSSSPLAFYTCEPDSLRLELQQELDKNHIPVCEPSNYLENTARGSVQISGQSCYCTSEICNHPQLSGTTSLPGRRTPAIDIPETNINGQFQGNSGGRGGAATSPAFSREFNIGSAVRPSSSANALKTHLAHTLFNIILAFSVLCNLH